MNNRKATDREYTHQARSGELSSFSSMGLFRTAVGGAEPRLGSCSHPLTQGASQLKRSTVATVVFCVGGAVAMWFGQELAEDRRQPPLQTCLYDPRTGEPMTTPCAK